MQLWDSRDLASIAAALSSVLPSRRIGVGLAGPVMVEASSLAGVAFAIVSRNDRIVEVCPWIEATGEAVLSAADIERAGIPLAALVEAEAQVREEQCHPSTVRPYAGSPRAALPIGTGWIALPSLACMGGA